MAYRSRLLCGLLLGAAFCTWGTLKLRADSWQPISKEDLSMTGEPKAPGAPAIILYRQVDRDDGRLSPHEFNYIRIKILTEEGRKYGDIEIPFVKERGEFRGIKARTIQPDGRIVPYEGAVYDKTIVKTRGWRYLAKTFSLPDVHVGTIIEYYYSIDLNEHYVFDSQWILSSELYTRKAKFTLKKYPQFAMRWNWPRGLPEGTPEPKLVGDTVLLEAHDIPAFTTEDYMPPENELKYRVLFVYTDGPLEQDAAKFWKQQGKSLNSQLEGFINKRKAMEQAVSEIVSAGDSPETKLQKIYARVQQLRNRSFERQKSEQELKRDKEKGASNVEDVWKQGAGNAQQLDYLFIALARVAGFEAYCVKISTRNIYLFHRELMNAFQLNTEVVLVKLNGKDLFLDPGAAFVPYGLLPWQETALTGLRLDKAGGEWMDIPYPNSSASRIERKAELALTRDGSLEGALTVTYSGLEALWLRMDELEEDDASRKKLLEDMVKESIPTGIDVELTNKPEWKSSAPELVAQYKLTVPGWATSVGKRTLLPAGLFGGDEKHLFEHGNRIHPVYFHFPYQKIDSISIALPVGWTPNSLPAPLDKDIRALAFTCKTENDRGTLHINRKLRSDVLVVKPEDYQVLRNFYQMVRNVDEQPIMLQPAN